MWDGVYGGVCVCGGGGVTVSVCVVVGYVCVCVVVGCECVCGGVMGCVYVVRCV